MRREISLFPLTAVLVIAGSLAGCGPAEIPASDAGDGFDAGRDGERDGGDVDDAGLADDAGPEDSGAPAEDAGDGGSDAGGCSTDCSAIEAPPCTMAVCNDGSLPGEPGECVMVPLPDATACDDGDFCTVGDTCTAGVCTGAPNDCGMTPGECRQIVCNSTTETCAEQGDSTLNGMSCTYPDPCVSGTTCSDGLCTGGTRMDCSGLPVPNECQAATCNPTTGACELANANEGGACVNPADPCLVGSTCRAGTCGVGTTPRDCSAMDSQCSVGVCDPTDGSCVATPANEGAPCDDGVSCTADTVCTAGICAGGTGPACSMTSDGCCPTACTGDNDADCGCPGELIGGTCVYLPTTVSAPDQTSARGACTALGVGWDLCSAAVLCMPATVTYLASSGCGCGGGAATCACGSSDNIYVHVDGTSPYYVRGPSFPSCISSMACTDSVSESCGVALCCR